MRPSPKRGLSGFVAVVVFVLETSSTFGLQFKNETDSTNNSLLPASALFQTNPLIVNSSNDAKKSEDTIVNAHNVTEGGIPATINKRITKNNGRIRRRKNRKKRKGLLIPSTIAPFIPGVDQNKLRIARKKVTNRKRKRKNRRKNKKLRKKQKQESNNILEVTTAREGLHPPNTSSNSTISELIRKLNDNPEDNFEDFHLRHENRSLILAGLNGRNVANLVAPVPAAAQHFPITLNDNITLHVSVGNGTKQKNPSKKYNRCRRNKGGCAHYCNPKGKVKCSCIEGFFLGPDQKTCLDIDECKTNNGGCSRKCVNTLGSYECHCPPGLRLGDNRRSCEDINECHFRNGHGDCQDYCINTFGSYVCSCARLNNTKLSEDGHTCVDLDECAKNNGGCSHACINTIGSAFCTCPDGMELSSDWKTCQDVNECEDDDVKKSCKRCVNTEGSYHCEDFSGYQNDQTAASVACKPLFPPLRGYITCSRDGASISYTKAGRRRVTNSPGTSCRLTCPTGYRMVGQFYVVCGFRGQWEGRENAKCIRAQSPKLECPPMQFFAVDQESQSASVVFPSPKTNINWKYVKSYPSWAKDLTGVLKEGRYDIHFTVKDPSTRLTASCSFKIVVE